MDQAPDTWSPEGVVKLAAVDFGTVDTGGSGAEDIGCIFLDFFIVEEDDGEAALAVVAPTQSLSESSVSAMDDTPRAPLSVIISLSSSTSSTDLSPPWNDRSEWI